MDTARTDAKAVPMGVHRNSGVSHYALFSDPAPAHLWDYSLSALQLKKLYFSINTDITPY